MKEFNWCYPVQGMTPLPVDMGCQIKMPVPDAGYLP